MMSTPAKLFATALLGLFGLTGTALAKCEEGEKKLLLALQKGASQTVFGRLAKEIQTQFQRDLNGKVCVDVVEQELPDGAAALANLQDGKAAIAAVAFADLASTTPFFRVLTMPFALDDRRAAARFIRAAKRPEWSAAIDSGKSKAIGLAHFGFDQLAANKPLVAPINAVGVKFLERDKITDSLVPLLKATRVSFSASDMAAALGNGWIEAQSGPWTTLKAPLLVKTYKAFIETNQMWRGAVVVASPTALTALGAVSSDQIEQQITKGIANFNKRKSAQLRLDRENLMRGTTPVFALTRKQRDQWRAAIAPVTDTLKNAAETRPFLDRLAVANR